MMILIIGSFASVPIESSLLVGPMVGEYRIRITESRNPQRPNDASLSLNVWVDGYNMNSSYINCGTEERLETVKCKIPDQDHEVSQHPNETLIWSCRNEPEERKEGKWLFDITNALVMVFTLTLRNGDNRVNFTLETVTDITDAPTNSSDYTVTESITESVSFSYRVKTNYMSAHSVLTAGLYISGVVIAVLSIPMAAKWIIPKEPEKR